MGPPQNDRDAMCGQTRMGQRNHILDWVDKSMQAVTIITVSTNYYYNKVEYGKRDRRFCHSSAPAIPDVCGRGRQNSVRPTDTTDTGTQSSATPRYNQCTTFASHTLQPQMNQFHHHIHILISVSGYCQVVQRHQLVKPTFDCLIFRKYFFA